MPRKYLFRAVVKDYRRMKGCINQTLMEVSLAVTSNANPCAAPSAQKAAHGWLCDSHMTASIRRRSVQEDTDAATIAFILATDAKAIAAGVRQRVNGVPMLRAPYVNGSGH